MSLIDKYTKITSVEQYSAYEDKAWEVYNSVTEEDEKGQKELDILNNLIKDYHSLHDPLWNVKQKYNPSDFFIKSQFWDCKFEELKFYEDSSFIIKRILGRSRGIEDFESLEKVYSIELIKFIALESHELIGNEKIETIAKRYDLNPESFPKWIKNMKDYS